MASAGSGGAGQPIRVRVAERARVLEFADVDLRPARRAMGCERIKRRHALASRQQVQARKRKRELLARAGGGDAQQFRILGAQFDAERLPLRLQQQRIFCRRTREQPFVHARHENAAERHAARLFDAAHPDLAEARILGRRPQRGEARTDHQQHLSEAHRTDLGHGLEFFQQLRDAVRLAQGGFGQIR